MQQRVPQLWKHKGKRDFAYPVSALVLVGLGFGLGFCVAWIQASNIHSIALAREQTVLPPANQYKTVQADPKVARELQGTLQSGIYPLLRDFQCGAANLVTPRAIGAGTTGRGRFVVDVGLGEDGQETLDAVTNGFTVFSFEMMSGSMAGIKKEAKRRGILHKLHFVEFQKGTTWSVEPKPLPLPPKDGSGFAYIFNAGLSDESGGMIINDGVNPTAKVLEQQLAKQWEPGMIPFVTLEQALPSWVDSIYFAKIDTQGWEAKVLRGMEKILDKQMIQYLQYEFSPWLMTDQDSGDPYALLQLLPSKGAVCFDMMGQHNKLTRPSKPLKDYFDVLNGGKNGDLYPYDVARTKYREDKVGPWDDILCWFPSVTA